MKHYIFSKLTCLVIASTLLSGLGACTDELKYNTDGEVEAGLPATLKLKISVPDMAVYTRDAGTAPEEATRVNNLWVGIFDGTTKEKTAQIVLGSSSEVTPHELYGVINLESSVISGYAYIVAVANASGKNYYLPDADARQTSDDPVVIADDDDLLSCLENNIESWDEYNRLITYMTNNKSISRQGTSSFIMSGVYTPSNTIVDHSSLTNSGTITIQPGENSGYIHLRRLDAYNLFKIKAGENIELQPVSWQVINVPAFSYIHEQDGNVNASDVYLDLAETIYKTNPPVVGVANDVPVGDLAYHDSEEYGVQFFNENNGVYSFDFYIRENKHEGIIDLEKVSEDKEKGDDFYVYNLREKEWKDGEYQENNIDNGSEGTDEPDIADVADSYRPNTGWYKSLVKNPGVGTSAALSKNDGSNDLWNNNATYVVINMKISYWYKKGDGDAIPVNYDSYQGEKSELIYRTAVVAYTVHLGYCEGEGDEKINDFSCKRNSHYTYNIEINGVNKVKVEATGNEAQEIQPGVEGMVTDLTGEPINLDSHYGVVNIQLTDDERESLVWRIQAPHGSVVEEMVGGNNIREMIFPSSFINTEASDQIDEKSNLPNNPYYNWIQIRPTTDENIIAPYPGDPRLLTNNKYNSDKSYIKKYREDDDAIWYLNDLCDPANHPHTSKQNGDNDKNTPRWYTIFIDEYVYEDLGWGDYVNADDRKFWLLTGENVKVSADMESTYTDAKYMISQESIQSFYSSTRTDDNDKIIGIESLNESYWYIGSYAFNKNQSERNPWTWSHPDTDLSLNNGLYNQWHYAENKKWEDIYSYLDNNGTNKDMTFRLGDYDKENFSDNHEYKFYIPNHKNDFMNGCLARNRDLNNDGKIDQDEVRWYLPTVGTYLQMMLGSGSLRSPLFSAGDYEASAILAGTGEPFSHYAASDKQQIWAEELTATGKLKYNEKEESGNLRCIRNLGFDYYTTSEPDKDAEITEPYKDNEDNTIELYYYRSTNLRDFTADDLGAHSVEKRLAYGSRMFQYAKTYCMAGVNLSPDYDSSTDYKLTNDNYVGDGYGKNGKPIAEKDWTKSLNSNSICRYYYEDSRMRDVGEWRVPNITELAILYFLNVDVVQAAARDKYDFISSSYEYFEGRNHYYMGLEKAQKDKLTAGDFYKPRVLCVKDIETNY